MTASFEPPCVSFFCSAAKVKTPGSCCNSFYIFFFCRTTVLFSMVVSLAEGSTNSTQGFLFLKASPTLTFFVVFGHYQTRRCEV